MDLSFSSSLHIFENQMWQEREAFVLWITFSSSNQIKEAFTILDRNEFSGNQVSFEFFYESYISIRAMIGCYASLCRKHSKMFMYLYLKLMTAEKSRYCLVVMKF